MSSTTRILAIFRGQLAPLIFGIIFTPVIVRVLPPAEYGDYTYILSLLGTIKFFTLIGLPETARRYLGSRDDIEFHRHIVSLYFFIATGTGIVAAGLIFTFALSGVYTSIFPTRYGHLMLILGILLFLTHYYSVARQSLMGLGYEPVSEWMPVARAGLQNVTAVLGGVLGLGALGALLGATGALTLVSLVGILILYRQVPIRPGSTAARTDVDYRTGFTSSAGNAALMFGMTAIQSADVILLGAISTSESVAFYRAALLAGVTLEVVPMTIQGFFVHGTASDWEQGQKDALARSLRRGIRLGLVLASLLGIGLFVLSDRFIPLYFGSQYLPALTPIRILIPGIVLFGVARIMMGIGMAQSRRKMLVAAAWLAAAANVIGNLILIPQYEIVGAAAASTASYGILSLALLLVMFEFGIVSSLLNPTIRVIATIGLGGGAIYAVDRITDAVLPGSLFVFVIVPIVGGGAYLLIAFATRGIELSELQSVLKEIGVSIPFGRT